MSQPQTAPNPAALPRRDPLPWSSVVAAFALSFLLPIAGQFVAVQPWGTDFILHLAHMLPGFACAGFCAALLLLFSRSDRRDKIKWLAAGAGCLVLLIAGICIGFSMRRIAFQQLATRSAPLVAAIKSYQTKYGRPPATLDTLVPEFLPSVPHTGMGACPDYQYVVGADAAYFANNPWVLKVNCSQAFINFDVFIYLPLQNYPQHGFGGSIERMGAWGYVHE